MNTAERIRLPDDCTIGYIVEALLGVPLIRSGLFHSHLENLQQVPASELQEQVCLLAPSPPPLAGHPLPPLPLPGEREGASRKGQAGKGKGKGVLREEGALGGVTVVTQEGRKGLAMAPRPWATPPLCATWGF